jgi:hypothetical protein
MMDTVTHIAGQTIMACGRVVQRSSLCVEKLCDSKNMMAHVGPNGSAPKFLSWEVGERVQVGAGDPKWCSLLPDTDKLPSEQDFVIYAHADLDMVKKLLEKEPALLNATMDWGSGDWETGLGGASHMGRRDIVDYLLERGARIDIFCAAMMGRLDAVKSFLELEPMLIDAKGPHGFTLHFHAQVGSKEAEPVLA